MKVIRPIPVTSAMLVSSSIAEPYSGETAWSSATTYALGDTVYVAATHTRYKSLQASNLNHDPTTDTTATWWASIGGTNRYAMFDAYVSTASSDASPITVTFDPGVIDGLFLYGMIGNTCTISMLDSPGGSVVYSKVLNLQTPVINDWYAYYFSPFSYVPFFVLTDIPPYANGRITITIAGTGTVSCGMVLPGRSYTIGYTLNEPRIGIRDYSKKTTDANTGFTVLQQGRFAKTMIAQVRLANNVVNEVHATLEGLRATACVWIGDDTGSIQPLTVYGFFKDMYLTQDLPAAGKYYLEVEGMV